MKFKVILTFFVIVLFPLFLMGQGGPAPDPCPPCCPPECIPTRAPITEGVIFLLLAAFGIGIKSFSRKKKN